MAKNNLYKKVSLEVGAVLNENCFKHSIMPDTMQKELVVKFDDHLYGEARNMADAALDSAVSYIQTILGLKHRPLYSLISPNTAVVQKEFDDSDFARQ
jgi:hypothetical protein